MREFYDAHRDYNKFAVVFNALIHNKVDRLENGDEDLIKFFADFEKSEHVNNTVVFFMGDHGLRTSTFRSTLQVWFHFLKPLYITLYSPTSFCSMGAPCFWMSQMYISVKILLFIGEKKVCPIIVGLILYWLEFR